MNLLEIQPNIVSKGVEGKFFLFYGEPSTRKTTVASRFPNSLLLATEIGYSLIPGVHAVNIDNWATFRGVVRQLKDAEVRDKYQTVVIDTVGLLADMAVKYICDINGVKELSEVPWGQGWTNFKKEFRNQINYIAQLGYSIVFIAHSEVKRDNETGKIVSAMPSIDRRPREAVIALVDFILFLQKEENEQGEITVYAYSNLPSIIETKSRARYLKPKFEFTFENLETEVQFAVEQYEKVEAGLITDEVLKPHVVEAVVQPETFAELRKEVLDLAGELINAGPPTSTLVEQSIISIMKGVRVSEATEEYTSQITTLREALYDIKNSV